MWCAPASALPRRERRRPASVPAAREQIGQRSDAKAPTRLEMTGVDLSAIPHDAARTGRVTAAWAAVPARVMNDFVRGMFWTDPLVDPVVEDFAHLGCSPGWRILDRALESTSPSVPGEPSLVGGAAGTGDAAAGMVRCRAGAVGCRGVVAVLDRQTDRSDRCAAYRIPVQRPG